jgi:uncharacterized protein YggE
MKIVQIGVVAVLLAGAVAYAGVGRPGSAHGSAPPATHGVTVTGTGSVGSMPDRASFSFGVSTNGVTASQASAENARKARKVIAALLGAGIAKADLQTQDVTVGPSWNDEGRPDGFAAHSSVVAKVRTSPGRARSWTLPSQPARTSPPGLPSTAPTATSLPERASPRLRRCARHRRRLASEAGASVGQCSASRNRAFRGAGAARGQSGARLSPTPVEPGTEEVQATISATFSLA